MTVSLYFTLETNKIFLVDFQGTCTECKYGAFPQTESHANRHSPKQSPLIQRICVAIHGRCLSLANRYNAVGPFNLETEKVCVCTRARVEGDLIINISTFFTAEALPSQNIHTFAGLPAVRKKSGKKYFLKVTEKSGNFTKSQGIF